MINLFDRAILNLAPKAEFSTNRIDGREEQVTWHSADISQPSDAAIASEIARLVIVDAKEVGKKCILDFAENLRKKLAKNPTVMQVAGWPLKLALAEKFQSGATLTPAEELRINSEITLRGKGESIDLLTTKVITQSGDLALAVGVIDGMQSSALYACESCTTAEEVTTLCDTLLTQATEELNKLKGI